jgi:hypothetical protein
MDFMILFYFWDGGLNIFFLGWIQTHDPPAYASQLAGIIDVYHHI